MSQRGSPPPFALLFPLASLDAIAVGGGWLAALCGRHAHWTTVEAVEWHDRELLFGFVAAAMAGFLFTALPRWTGKPVGHRAVRAFIFVWVAARIVPSHPWPLGLLQMAPGALLAMTAAFHVTATHDRRDRKIVVLLAFYAASAVIRCGPFDPTMRTLGAQIAIAALLGLAMVIGGRVIPALAGHFDALRGEPSRSRRSAVVEPTAAWLAVASIASYLLTPEAHWTAPVLFVAGAAQLLRMGSWIRRRTFEAPSLVGLISAYACIPLGFILLAAHAGAPDVVPTVLAVHVWAIGVLGGMILTIMASMTRKRCGLAFVALPGSDAAAPFCLVAALVRAVATFDSRLLPVAATAWSAAFILFLFAFRAPLFSAAFKAPPMERRRKDPTEIHS
jgi:uncharacterized protein involved in response to NO